MKTALVVAALAVYVVGLGRAGREILNEDWDGIKTVNNALLVAHAGGPAIPLDLQRAPLGWLATAPALARAYRNGGALAAVETAHALFPIYAGLLVLGSWLLLRGLASPASAAVAAALLAVNPIVVQFAPFALLDIFGGLAALAFFAAALRYLDRPGAGSWGLVAAAAAAAFLSKYHLGLLIAGALAAAALEKERARLLPPLLVLPPLCWLAGWAALTALTLWVYGRGHDAAAVSWRELARDFSFNLLSPKEARWTLYPVALWAQLGLGLSALAAAGLWAWLAADGAAGRRLALLLLVPYAGLAFGVANKEARYAIPLLPLVYAAVARGLDLARERLGAATGRRAAFAAALALAPWRQSLAAVRYLEREPSIHTLMPWELGRRVEKADCVGWARGDMAIPIEEPLFRYERHLLIGAPTFQFFTRARVVELASAETGCGALVEPLAGPALARVVISGRRWDALADRLVERK